MDQHDASSHGSKLLTKADLPGLLVLLVVGFAMACWSWLSWMDPVVDFGRELYTPWQLTRGKVLYRDMMLFNGPLSQYFNAMLFVLFGTSLRTLVVANLIILALTVLMVFTVIRDLSSRLAATFSGMSFLLLFAFNQYSIIGNFNWICPYSHELTHGSALSVLALVLAGRWVKSHNFVTAFFTGLVAGLVFLTKVEVFVACICSLAVAWLLPLLIAHAKARTWLPSVGWLFIGLLIPPMVACLLLYLAMPLPMAITGTMGSWAYVLVKEHTALPFFRWSMGSMSIKEQLIDTLAMLGWYALLIVPFVFYGMSLTRSWRWRVLAFVTLFAALLRVMLKHGAALLDSPVAWLEQSRHWAHFAYPWPLFVLIVACVLLWRLWRERRNSACVPQLTRAIVFTVFALLMVLKMLLNVRLWQYGFALALPAGIMLTVILCDGLPLLLAKYRIPIWLTRSWMLVLWGLVLVFHLTVAGRVFNHKQIAVAQGADQFYSYRRGEQVNEALDYLKANALPTDTITVMPDGEIIAYLTRMTNPSKFGNFIPATIMLFGEANMLDDLQSHSPTWLVLVHRNTSEYGAANFGQDYAKEIWQWIESDYVPVFRTGAMPFNPENQFGIVIAKRRGVGVSSE